MLGNERLELGNHLAVPAELKPGLDQLLERRQPELLEATDLGLREGLIGQVRERRTAP